MKLHTATLNGETRLSRTRNHFAIVLLACFAAAFSAHAQSSPLLSSNRFLFIIDASTSMKPFDNGLRESVFDFIYTGLRGRMTNGDTYGVWVVTDRNDTTFPMETWRLRSGVEMGVKATAHVKDRAFKGNARLDLAMADALRVVKNVGDLTIVVVSNGETPLAGTPFDDAINARFRELAPQMKRAKVTLNTALVARDGVIVAWAANAPEFLIDIPNVAPKPKPAKPEVVAAPANAPAASTSATARIERSPFKNAVNPLLQSRGGAPIIITKETVAADKREFTSMASTVTNPAPELPSTNSIAISSNSNSIADSVGPSNDVATVVVATNTTASAAPVPTPVLNEKSAPATNVAAVKPSPQKPEVATSPAPSAQPTLPTSSLHPATPITASVGSRTEPKSSAFSPIGWSLIGAAGALLCVLVVALVARRRQESSLISQAIAQGRIV